MLNTMHRGYTYLRTDRDVLWFDEGLRRGWSTPEPAPRWARLYGVRHARCLWLLLQDAYWDWCWEKVGMYPTGYHDWRRYAVLRGWA